MNATVVGVYGGTFDPIHLGHLAVAEAVRDAAGLNQVLFVPNRRQPLKSEGPWASPDLRLRMVRAAIAGNARFALSDVELRQEGPSYTIQTLDALRQARPEAEIRFILGTDAANGIASWREPRRILAEYRPLVMVRAGWETLEWHTLEAVHPRARELVQVLDVPLLAISSSDLRACVAAGRSVRYLVPDAVLAIIEAEHIYGDPAIRA